MCYNLSVANFTNPLQHSAAHMSDFLTTIWLPHGQRWAIIDPKITGTLVTVL